MCQRTDYSKCDSTSVQISRPDSSGGKLKPKENDWSWCCKATSCTVTWTSTATNASTPTMSCSGQVVPSGKTAPLQKQSVELSLVGQRWSQGTRELQSESQISSAGPQQIAAAWSADPVPQHSPQSRKGHASTMAVMTTEMNCWPVIEHPVEVYNLNRSSRVTRGQESLVVRHDWTVGTPSRLTL